MPRKFPTDTPAQARASVKKVKEHGTKAERARVFAQVRKKHPDVAKSSVTVATKSGTGRRVGQSHGARNKTATKSTGKGRR
jgi:formyltetrahydrofolate synthetase